MNEETNKFGWVSGLGADKTLFGKDTRFDIHQGYLSVLHIHQTYRIASERHSGASSKSQA
jgi:hypothetical protein